MKLGDSIAATLGGLGITKGRWVAFKAGWGLPKDCKCWNRQLWLNAFGKRFGDAARAAVEKIAPRG